MTAAKWERGKGGRSFHDQSTRYAVCIQYNIRAVRRVGLVYHRFLERACNRRTPARLLFPVYGMVNFFLFVSFFSLSLSLFLPRVGIRLRVVGDPCDRAAPRRPLSHSFSSSPSLPPSLAALAPTRKKNQGGYKHQVFIRHTVEYHGYTTLGIHERRFVHWSVCGTDSVEGQRVCGSFLLEGSAVVQQ